MLSSAKPIAPQTWNRFAYVVNNPLKFVDPSGLCSVPTGLKQGQVGICFEAFIAASRVGPGGMGHGDGRGFAGNDPSLTARVTVWAIISRDEKNIYINQSSRVSNSVATVAKGMEMAGTNGPPANVASDGPKENNVSLPGSATTKVQVLNNETIVGEKDFGKGISVMVSIENGANGGQQLGKNIQTAGVVPTAGPVAGAIIQGVGKVVEALAPSGTIDGYVVLGISGNGQVDFKRMAVKGFPSYAVYSYTVDANGNVQTNKIREVPETTINQLTEPMKKVP